MKLKEAIIKKFKRAALSGHENFHFKFSSPIHFLLGSNGSGKSSLQSYLAVRLPDANDFRVGGSWCIRFVDSNLPYEIGAEFTKQGTKHWFNLGEERLNEGGTGTVQKQLIERHFGIKVQILELLTDTTPFTQMSVNRRRELFTLLNPTSMAYAQGLYHELRKQLNATHSVLTYTRKRLTVEQEVVFDSKLLEEYETQLAEYEAQLKLLYGQQREIPRPEGFGRYVSEIEQMVQSILNPSTAELIEQVRVFGGMEGLRESLREERNRLGFLQQQQPGLAQNVKELSERLQEIRGLMGTDVLLERKAMFESELERLRATGWLDVIPANVTATKALYETLESAQMGLIEHLGVLARLQQQERVYGQQELVGAEQTLNHQRNRIADLKAHIQHLQHSLEHVRGVDVVQCPECSSNFRPGVRPGEVERVRKALEESSAALVALEAELPALEENYAVQLEFSQSLGGLRQIAAREILLRPWFDALVDLGFPAQGAAAGIQLVESWKHGAKARFEAGEIQSQLEYVEQQLTTASMSAGESKVALESQYTQLTTTLEDLTTEITETRDRVEGLGKLVRAVEQSGLLVWEEGWQDEYRSRYEHEVEWMRQSQITKAIQTLQTQVGVLSDRIRKRAVAQGLVQDLQSQIAQLESEHQELKVLVDELSPANGLIAEQMSGFVAMFAAKLNQVLQSVWSYPIRVLPCGLEDGDLNYLFPVEQFDSQYVSRDVSKCSEGQQDIINFAFKLALVEYLNHPEWPMYLDELGGSFDEHHRVKLVEYIKHLTDTQKVPQIFWISHYASTHSSLVDAEVFVVCGDNILTPKVHSEHVECS